MRCSRLLYKVCKASGMLPASYILPSNLVSVGEYGWGGGFAEVSKGEYRGRPVAVKHLKIKTRDGFDKIFKVRDRTRLATSHCRLRSTQRLCREILVWKRLSHQNVLPLLGVSVSKNPQHFRIISEWMPNGSVTEYVGSNPEVNRMRLVSPAVHFPWCLTLTRALTHSSPRRRLA